MHSLLKPGGKLVGVLFNRAFEGGPPFGGNMDEYQDLFEPTFTLQTLASCYNSIKPRMGQKYLSLRGKITNKRAHQKLSRIMRTEDGDLRMMLH